MLEPSKNRAQGEKRRGRSGLEKGLIGAVVLVSVLAVVFLVLYFTKNCSPSEEVCTEKKCVKASAQLLDFVDLKVDPCKDFYHYVCGHYIKDAVKNDATTPIKEIMKLVENEQKAIIVDPVRKKDSKANVAMKMFYQACMNESRIESDKDANFLEAINELGGWHLLNATGWDSSSFNWLDWQVKAVQMGVPVIGFFDLKPEETSENTTVLRISASILNDLKMTRMEFMGIMSQIAAAFDAPSSASDDIKTIYQFFKDLKELAIDYEDSGNGEDEVSTVKDLIQECPQIPWLKLLNGLSKGVREFKTDTEVIFGSLSEYCKKLIKLLNNTPKWVISDYYVWSIIHKSRDFLREDVRDAYKGDETQDRFKKCFQLTDESFKYLKETIYIRKKTNPYVREQLEELVDIMKEVFIEHIKASTWMDEETKKRGAEKAQLIEKVVGADEVLYDVDKFDKLLGVDGIEYSSDVPYQIFREKRIRENKHIWEKVNEKPPENWDVFFHSVNQVNAFFATPLNVMIIPAPILNSVFFNYKFPAFMNYGSIGRVIGHELQHGFGEAGRQVLLKNNEQVDWWTNATVEAFNKTKKCAIDEYEQIPFTYKLNGTLTLEENLADLVGIDVAYEAYGRWLEKYGEEKSLPGIPLTPKQIFWIQTGTFLCFRKLDDDATDMNAEDVHAIPLFRVTAGARNSKYFAKDFNCPEGSFMNPKQKCRIL